LASACLSSTSSVSFILDISIPALGGIVIHALVDSGASSNFVDSGLISAYQSLLSSLAEPIQLSLFDGSPAMAGFIRHSLDTPIRFADDTSHSLSMLVTTLHPSAQVVLGLPWLRTYNPDIDWSTLSLSFRDRVSTSLPLKLSPKLHLLQGGLSYPQSVFDPAANELQIISEIHPFSVSTPLPPDPRRDSGPSSVSTTSNPALSHPISSISEDTDSQHFLPDPYEGLSYPSGSGTELQTTTDFHPSSALGSSPMPLSCDHGPSPGIISPKPQEAPSRSSGVGNGPQHTADCNPPSAFGSSPLTQQCDYVPSPAPIISEPSSCNPKPSVSEHIADPLPIPNAPLTDCI